MAPSLCSSGTRLLACPSPHSCLVNSSSWLQALGQRLLTHKVPWAQAGGLPVPFTHCTLPPPETRRPVLSHQQTCQGLSGCQALAWAPSHSSSKQPLSASPRPLQPPHEGPSVLLSSPHPGCLCSVHAELCPVSGPLYLRLLLPRMLTTPFQSPSATARPVSQSKINLPMYCLLCVSGQNGRSRGGRTT